MKTTDWQQELAVIDRTMRAISSISDPQELVRTYWTGIGELLPIEHYLAVSRRGVTPPAYLVTRSSRFKEPPNPWTQREQLPLLSGGLVAEIAYSNQPVIIDDLPDRLSRDDPAFSFLEGFESLVALPQYDGGEGLNVSMTLFPPGRQIDRAAIPMMHWQAALFGRGTQNLVLRNQLADALGALDRELQVVGDIQRSLLPGELPHIAGYDLAAHYVTSARAGGDYYDFFRLRDGCWGIFIADVSGHGTPAAVVMAITHALAHAQPDAQTPPAQLLNYLNDHLVRSYTLGGTFVTAFYGVLDPRRGVLTYSTGGHNPPRLAQDGKVHSLDRAGALPLGILASQRYEEATVQIAPGHMLLLYTDGITEALGPGRTGGLQDMFGVERLDARLLSSRGATAAACLAGIRADLEAFTGGAAPTDDQTLVAIGCI